MNREEAEKHLRQTEQMSLEPYTCSASWYGITIEFERCAKRDGGDIRKGKAWGRLIYSNTLTGQNMSRNNAIEFALLSPALRKAKYEMLCKKLCAICGKEGIDDHYEWGYLKYLEHEMDICPDCKKDIYEESHQPWRDN